MDCILSVRAEIIFAIFYNSIVFVSGEKEVAQYPFGSGNIKITCQPNKKEEILSDAHGR